MRDYLRGRASLSRVFVLIDARRGVKDVDEEMFNLLDQSGRVLSDRPDQA